MIVLSREPSHEPSRRRPAVVVEVSRPTSDEQRQLWHTALGEHAPRLNGQVDAITGQFDLAIPAIQAASIEAIGRLRSAPDSDVGDLVWQACRIQARPGLDNLAQRLDPGATWDDLILPEPQCELLRELAAQVRQRHVVYQRWGFGEAVRRGLGISALFAGPSGTGKTMAAEVLANELQLDLYRIDLSAVVSKYIGETEKNLRRVFDAAESGGAILLFDEADALFGKRSEVKDSHDRYANIEVGYLLQRMEAYSGLAILTTNLKGALDTAFMRRLRFVVHFPFPDVEQRAALWRRAFPSRAPTDELDVDKLARLTVSGGNIRSIVLNAAFLAADHQEPLQMRHLLRAAQVEYAKLEKSMLGAEIDGWLS
jgi:SpoVK/Ycf46/Vps4 family AAA+-type ATPase